MSKIAFFQEELRERFSFMSLSAFLKAAGHSCEVFIESNNDKVIDEIVSYKPDIIGFSVMTANYNYIRDKARMLKQRSQAFLIIGGPHAILFPEEIDKDRLFDAICIGEGEKTLVELAENLRNGRPYELLKNLWVRRGEKLYRNDIDNLLDINTLPDLDRGIYFEKYPSLARTNTKRFLVARGCPFDCTYCFNHTLKRLYKDKGAYVRFRAIEKIINEMKSVREIYGMKWVQLNADTININKNWFLSFLDEYKKEIGLPFMTNIRIDYIDEEVVNKMKDAGCDRVDFGVEHGNEEIRKEILGRKMSNEDIIKNSSFFRKNKIRIHTSSIIGVPGEDLNSAYETIHLNAKIKPEIAISSTLHPYKKTRIYDYAIDKNLLKDDYESERGYSFQPSFDRNEFTCSIKVKNERQILNLYFWFDIFVKYPILSKILKPVLSLPPNRFFNMVKAYPLMKLEFKYASSWDDRLLIIKDFLKMSLRKIKVLEN